MFFHFDCLERERERERESLEKHKEDKALKDRFKIGKNLYSSIFIPLVSFECYC
jgi:hypothetical protein